MTHRFPIKEIALQAGLSTATVDRVLNGRAHVSAQTKARVAAAVGELEGQEAQLSKTYITAERHLADMEAQRAELDEAIAELKQQMAWGAAKLAELGQRKNDAA